MFFNYYIKRGLISPTETSCPGNKRLLGFLNSGLTIRNSLVPSLWSKAIWEIVSPSLTLYFCCSSVVPNNKNLASSFSSVNIYSSVEIYVSFSLICSEGIYISSIILPVVFISGCFSSKNNLYSSAETKASTVLWIAFKKSS